MNVSRNASSRSARRWDRIFDCTFSTHGCDFLLLNDSSTEQKAKATEFHAEPIEKGDKIVTIGGLHGTIAEITDDVVVLRVNDVTKLTFDRNAISTAVARDTAVE